MLLCATIFLTAQTIQAQVPTNGLQLWLRADSAEVVGTPARVQQLYDLSGNNRHATQPTAQSRPTRITSADFGNRPTIRFETGGTGFQFPRLTNIRTVFMVLKSTGAINVFQFLLGDSTTFDFHCGNVPGTEAGLMFSPTFASPAIANGNMRYNGRKTNPVGTLRPTESTIVTVQTTGNVSAGLLSFDRPPSGATANRSWRGEIAEVLIYSDSLTTSQRRAVEVYLAERYAITLKNPTLTQPPISSEKLERWYRADRVQTDASLRVTTLIDLSDEGDNAFQAGTTLRPSLVGNAGNFGGASCPPLCQYRIKFYEFWAHH